MDLEYILHMVTISTEISHSFKLALIFLELVYLVHTVTITTGLSYCLWISSESGFHIDLTSTISKCCN